MKSGYDHSDGGGGEDEGMSRDNSSHFVHRTNDSRSRGHVLHAFSLQTSLHLSSFNFRINFSVCIYLCVCLYLCMCFVCIFLSYEYECVRV